jgi:hypothetical protein
MRVLAVQQRFLSISGEKTMGDNDRHPPLDVENLDHSHSINPMLNAGLTPG